MGERCQHPCDHITARAFHAAEWLEVIVGGNIRDPLPHMDLDWLIPTTVGVFEFLNACDAHHRATCPAQLPAAPTAPTEAA